MTLQEFLNYRDKCPVCDQVLTLVFSSQRRQGIKIKDDKLVIYMPLDAMNKNSNKYDISYSFGLNDNSFDINFYPKGDMVPQNCISLSLINRFKDLHKNLITCKIYKYCNKCSRYNYSTEEITINYRNASFEEISVSTEYICFDQAVEGGSRKIYRMLNYYNHDETWLSYGKFNSTEGISVLQITLPQTIKTVIIPFTNCEETAVRLSKLLVFS